MKAKSKGVLLFLHIIAWIVFVGLCIKTGAVVISFFVSLFVNPEAAKNLYMGLDLSNLYHYNMAHYVWLLSATILITALKAYIFYLVIKIFLTINLVHPFSEEVYKHITRIGSLSMLIGIMAVLASGYIEWAIKKGVAFPNTESFLGGGGEILLLGAIIFIISKIFKRGIDIQTENELTV